VVINKLIIKLLIYANVHLINHSIMEVNAQLVKIINSMISIKDIASHVLKANYLIQNLNHVNVHKDNLLSKIDVLVHPIDHFIQKINNVLTVIILIFLI